MRSGLSTTCVTLCHWVTELVTATLLSSAVSGAAQKLTSWKIISMSGAKWIRIKGCESLALPHRCCPPPVRLKEHWLEFRFRIRGAIRKNQGLCTRLGNRPLLVDLAIGSQR